MRLTSRLGNFSMILGQERQRAKVGKWPRAKRARTSSIFHTNTPTGPYRAIGPQWQNSREKLHVLAFWPTLWPRGCRGVRHPLDLGCPALAELSGLDRPGLDDTEILIEIMRSYTADVPLPACPTFGTISTS